MTCAHHEQRDVTACHDGLPALQVPRLHRPPGPAGGLSHGLQTGTGAVAQPPGSFAHARSSPFRCTRPGVDLTTDRPAPRGRAIGSARNDAEALCAWAGVELFRPASASPLRGGPASAPRKVVTQGRALAGRRRAGRQDAAAEPAGALPPCPAPYPPGTQRGGRSLVGGGQRVLCVNVAFVWMHA